MQQDTESYWEIRSNTADWRVPDISINGETTGYTTAKQRHKTYRDVRKTSAQEIIPLKTLNKSRRLTCSARNHKNYSSTWTSSNFAKILQKNSMSWSQFLYRDCLLQLREKLTYKRSLATFQKTNYDCFSIPDSVIRKNCSRGPKHDQSERQIMFFKTKKRLQKARQSKHGNHPNDSRTMVCTKKIRDSFADHYIDEKKIMLHDRIDLERNDFSATRAERPQNIKHCVFRFNADGSQILKMYFHTVWNARCSPDGNRTNSDTDTSTTSTASKTKSVIQKNAKNSITMSVAIHGETRQHLHLHLQLRSGHLRNDKRVGPRCNIHHLRSCADFGFLERISETRRRSVDSTPTNTAHTAQHSLFTSAGRTPRAWLKGQHDSRIAASSLCTWKESCLTLCCSLTCRAPRAHLLPHSIFLLPRHQNTHHNRDNTIYSKNTQCIINLSRISQSKSIAIKNHSGKKNNRVAETQRKTSTRCGVRGIGQVAKLFGARAEVRLTRAFGSGAVRQGTVRTTD